VCRSNSAQNNESVQANNHWKTKNKQIIIMTQFNTQVFKSGINNLIVASGAGAIQDTSGYTTAAYAQANTEGNKKHQETNHHSNNDTHSKNCTKNCKRWDQ
jgi:hypothetical protein